LLAIAANSLQLRNFYHVTAIVHSGKSEHSSYCKRRT